MLDHVTYSWCVLLTLLYPVLSKSSHAHYQTALTLYELGRFFCVDVGGQIVQGG